LKTKDKNKIDNKPALH